MLNHDEPRDSRELEEKIGYQFQNQELLREALTHSSYHNEMKGKGERAAFNERLEFLGDSVLSVIVSSYLFERYRAKQEGDLTKIRAAVVCEKALSKYAGEIGLGEYMYLGHGAVPRSPRTPSRRCSPPCISIPGSPSRADAALFSPLWSGRSRRC